MCCFVFNLLKQHKSRLSYSISICVHQSNETDDAVKSIRNLVSSVRNFLLQQHPKSSHWRPRLERERMRFTVKFELHTWSSPQDRFIDEHSEYRHTALLRNRLLFERDNIYTSCFNSQRALGKYLPARLN